MYFLWFGMVWLTLIICAGVRDKDQRRIGADQPRAPGAFQVGQAMKYGVVSLLFQRQCERAYQRGGGENEAALVLH